MITRRAALARLGCLWAADALAPAALRGAMQDAAPAEDGTGVTARPVADLARAVQQGTLSPERIVEAYLARIARLDPALHAFVTVTAERARAQARALTMPGRAALRERPLAGVPVAHKDLFETAGVRTTGGSRLYADRVPMRDAALVATLAAAGAVMLGKTNTHELGGGVTTVNPFYGTTHNPRDPSRIAGGSSGGSAAAVAAGLTPVATGSDTGGSIRIPAAFCGCVEFKPTYGLLDTRRTARRRPDLRPRGPADPFDGRPRHGVFGACVPGTDQAAGRLTQSAACAWASLAAISSRISRTRWRSPWSRRWDTFATQEPSSSTCPCPWTMRRWRGSSIPSSSRRSPPPTVRPG
ncbi:MAG: amidase [Vicinamibacterales bacterium]